MMEIGSMMLYLRKQNLRLRGLQTQFSARDKLEEAVQDDYVLVVIAEHNVVQFWNICVKLARKKGGMN